MGKPVAGARITVHDIADVKTITGADGLFQLTRAPHGEIPLFVDTEDYPRAYRGIKAGENHVRVTVRDDE